MCSTNTNLGISDNLMKVESCTDESSMSTHEKDSHETHPFEECASDKIVLQNPELGEKYDKSKQTRKIILSLKQPVVSVHEPIHKKYGICLYGDCQKCASFGHPGTKSRLYCNSHKETGMVNTRGRRSDTCQHSGCHTQASFGYQGTTTKIYCKKHKETDMVNVKSKKCQYPNCMKIPTYGHIGTKESLFCLEHKTEDMIDVVNTNKQCHFTGCKKRSSFGYVGSNKAFFCSLHKEIGMVDVINTKCSFAGCDKHPSFGLIGSKKAIFCSLHKEEGMVDLVSKKCQYPDCQIRASFGSVDSKKALFCAKHKEITMVNVKGLCVYPNCLKGASFNLFGSKKALYCSTHKENNMINVTVKPCQFVGCQTLPSYGLPGHRPIHCLTHKQIGEKSHPTNKCVVAGCKNLALFGYTSTSHCELHKMGQEINLVQRKCIECGLPDVLDENQRCSTCDPSQFTRFRLAKQKKVRDFFDYHHMKYISYDRMIDHGVCGKERPDFIFDCETHMIVVEVDENQHEEDGYDCEIVRMINVGQSLGMPTIFIRYNPDRYKTLSGRVETNEYKRMTSLKTQIEYWTSKQPPMDGCCYVTYLYYNNDDPTQWQNLVKLM